MLALTGQKYHGITLLCRCGGGAYGDVYYGEDLSGRRLAVKIISKEKLGDGWARELKGVIHYRKITENAPELLQIYHVEEDDDTFFYTMEAADSASRESYRPDTLASRLRGGPLPREDILRVLTEIFRGIATIHAAGFAHRDIKPDNILFVKGIPKLGDIGLLSSLNSTMTQIAGTMDFLPPEIRSSDSTVSDTHFSRKSNDLYAFGKVIYCCATGNHPREWPAVPAELPLTLPLKLFLRLSCRLCEKESLLRLTSTGKIERELQRIGRSLERGDTFAAKTLHSLRECAASPLRGAVRAAAWCLRHWIVCIVIALIAGSGIYWMHRRETRFEITHRRNKMFRDADIGISMLIPAEWEPVSAETARKLLNERFPEDDSRSPINEKRQQMFRQALGFKGSYIYCDYDPVFADNLAMQSIPNSAENLASLPDDEWRFHIQQIFRGELAYNSRVYDLKRTVRNSMPCIEISFSSDPGKSVAILYVFLRKGDPFSITLTSKAETYPVRREEVESVLKTLKIDVK
ncbi:MAG: protein kinase [Victivallaceae bacterium]|nr:protein kinase [Victivallaceae bacterium]